MSAAGQYGQSRLLCILHLESIIYYRMSTQIRLVIVFYIILLIKLTISIIILTYLKIN